MKNLTARAALTAVWLLLAAIAGAHGGGVRVVVDSVLPDSPAAAAGLENGDRFLRLAGQEIDTHEDLQKAMADHRPGDTVSLVVEREGGTVELSLTFGKRPEGGVSLGVSLAIVGQGPEMPEGEGLTRDGCLAWVDETYRADTMARELGLELAEDVAALRACLEEDVQMMPSPMPAGWCDNSFKVHCSGLDLLAEIGGALEERCAELLGEPLGSCAAQKVYDRYSWNGEASDEADCRAAREACSEAD